MMPTTPLLPTVIVTPSTPQYDLPSRPAGSGRCAAARNARSAYPYGTPSTSRKVMLQDVLALAPSPLPHPEASSSYRDLVTGLRQGVYRLLGVNPRVHLDTTYTYSAYSPEKPNLNLLLPPPGIGAPRQRRQSGSLLLSVVVFGLLGLVLVGPMMPYPTWAARLRGKELWAGEGESGDGTTASSALFAAAAVAAGAEENQSIGTTAALDPEGSVLTTTAYSAISSSDSGPFAERAMSATSSSNHAYTLAYVEQAVMHTTLTAPASTSLDARTSLHLGAPSTTLFATPRAARIRRSRDRSFGPGEGSGEYAHAFGPGQGGADADVDAGEEPVRERDVQQQHEAPAARKRSAPMPLKVAALSQADWAGYVERENGKREERDAGVVEGDRRRRLDVMASWDLH